MDRTAYLNYYKTKPNFGNHVKKRNEIASKLKTDRHLRRTCNFNARRNITDEASGLSNECEVTNSCSQNEKIMNRKLALEKFKADRIAVKEALKKKQRPPFKVGIPHHGFSPVLRELTNQAVQNRLKPDKISKEPQLEVRNQRVTRAMVRANTGNVVGPISMPVQSTNRPTWTNFKVPSPVQVFPFNERKSVFTFHRVMTVKKLTSPQTPNVLKRSTQKTAVFNELTKHKLQPKKLKTSSSADSGELLAVPLTDMVNLVKSTEPAVACSENTDQQRGENNQLPNDPLSHEQLGDTEGFPNICDTSTGVEDIVLTNNVETCRGKRINREQVDLPVENPSPKHERTKESIFQRNRLDEETRRLLSLADKWETVSQQTDMPEDVIDEIDSIVGNTRLLTRDKFNQFRGLVEQYENDLGSHSITCNDLNGFWEMMYLQVETLIQKYSSLENAKNNNWKQPKPAAIKKRRAVNKTKSNTTGSSNTRAQIETKPATSVKEDDSEVIEPKSKDKSVLDRGSSKRKSRSNSPSPYIAMRLSGIGRSLSVGSHQANETPKTILKNLIQNELYNSARKMVLFNNITSEEKTNIQGKTITQTTRRSMRLLSRTPTPMRARVCSACESPDCVKSDCVKENEAKVSRTSQRQNLSPMEKLEDVIVPKFPETDSKTQEGHDNAKQTASSKRFVLKPSNLIVNDDVIGTSSKTTRRSKRGKVISKESSPEESDFTGYSTRRSSRKTNIRKVTFNPESIEEKLHLKLPATPYRQSGSKEPKDSPKTQY